MRFEAYTFILTENSVVLEKYIYQTTVKIFFVIFFMGVMALKNRGLLHTLVLRSWVNARRQFGTAKIRNP